MRVEDVGGGEVSLSHLVGESSLCAIAAHRPNDGEGLRLACGARAIELGGGRGAVVLRKVEQASSRLGLALNAWTAHQHALRLLRLLRVLRAEIAEKQGVA